MLNIGECIEHHNLLNELVMTTERRRVQPVVKISLRLYREFMCKILETNELSA